MRVCMLGAGALGSTIGARLAEAGHDVCLVDTWGAHVDTINRQGLAVREGAAERNVKVRAATSVQGLGEADLVIVLVKSYHTREAIGAALAAVGPRTVVMSLQNGLGHEDILAEVVGRAKVIGGKTYAGGVLLEAGRVISGTVGKRTYIGELDGRVTPRVEEIAQAMTAAGLETHVSDNIVGTMWDKLLINVATGALAAITRLPYGTLYRVPEVEACALAAVAEGIAAARALGVRLSNEDPQHAWRLAKEGLPADFKTSMLQSIEKGSPTEVDYINGSVVRAGERCGVPTPVNRTLVACVKGIEAWHREQPGAVAAAPSAGGRH